MMGMKGVKIRTKAILRTVLVFVAKQCSKMIIAMSNSLHSTIVDFVFVFHPAVLCGVNM